jgi:colanic acid biosynthesis glycosyl transferase WcaI
LEPLCSALCRLRGLRVGLLIWDLYPDHVIAAGYAGGLNPVVAAWAWLNGASLRSAEVIITLGPMMAQRVGAQAYRKGGDQTKVEVIPIWADTDAIHPRDKRENEFACQHELTESLTILYSGNVGKSHSLGMLVDVAGRLEDLLDLVLVVIGDGAAYDALKEDARRQGRVNLRFLPWQPWDKLALSLSAGDVALVSQAAGTGDLSVPSRVYNVLAAGCALVALADATSDLAALVRNENVGIVCPPDDAASLEAAIRYLASNTEVLSAYKKRARQAAVKLYSLEAALARLKHVLTPFIAP